MIFFNLEGKYWKILQNDKIVYLDIVYIINPRNLILSFRISLWKKLEIYYFHKFFIAKIFYWFLFVDLQIVTEAIYLLYQSL